MAKVFLGLGSNVGDRLKFIDNAIAEIEKIQDLKLVRSSFVYETEPWGKKDQNRFLNSVIEVDTDLEPHILFRELKQIERKAGRKNCTKWAEREIDIDILFYGKNVIRNDILEIPHREIKNRRFVLVPLDEIAANFIHPVIKKSVSELLSSTNDVSEVCRYKTVV